MASVRQPGPWAGLGLKRGTLQILEHDERWLAAGAEAASLVTQAGGTLLPHTWHIGSTAVHGLPAKPILDLAGPGGPPETLPELAARLASIGFHYHGQPVGPDQHLFVLDVTPGIRAAHLHVVRPGSASLAGYVRFRDVLRSDPQLRASYIELKRRLLVCHPGDRAAYSRDKGDFIEAVLRRPGND